MRDSVVAEVLKLVLERLRPELETAGCFADQPAELVVVPARSLWFLTEFVLGLHAVDLSSLLTPSGVYGRCLPEAHRVRDELRVVKDRFGPLRFASPTVVFRIEARLLLVLTRLAQAWLVDVPSRPVLVRPSKADCLVYGLVKTALQEPVVEAHLQSRVSEDSPVVIPVDHRLLLVLLELVDDYMQTAPEAS